MFLRTAYNYDVKAASAAVSLVCEDDKTKQSFKEECDINEIVRRFGLTGKLPDVVNVPRYGDFTSVSDYQTAMNAVVKAKEDFMQLPADIRSQFDNNPQLLLEFISDDKNRDEAIRIGLISKPPEVFRPEKSGVPEAAVSPKP